MNSVVGSSTGTRDALSRIRCSRRSKCCRKRWRISGPVTGLGKFTRRTERAFSVLVSLREMLSQMLQGRPLQPRDVHLADAQALGHLRLGHLVEEPHDHDAALPLV